MPTVWLSLKKSLHCRSDTRDVHEPQKICMNHLTASIAGRRRSNCSKFIANQFTFKDVFCSGDRKRMQMGNGSPQSIASNELLNSMSHEVTFLRDSMIETNSAGLQQYKSSSIGGTPMSTVIPEGPTQSSAKHPPPSSALYKKLTNPLFNGCAAELINDTVICRKLNRHFSTFESLQTNHLLSNTVKELVEGDSTRNIVEIIFKTSWLKSEIPCGTIERVLKINHRASTVARFEEYREMVKGKASRLPKKHPRCLADGNEVLRFHGTTITCSLGMNGFAKLCNFVCCNVCQIIRTGFPTKQMKGRGIYTTATSGKAHDSINMCEDGLNMFPVKKAMFVCRVIAGRVHKPMDNVEAFSLPVGFDSVAGDIGTYSNLEELFVSNPRAVLPCFAVIYS